MKRLETERLILRGFRERDLEQFYRNSSNPNVGPMAGWKPHESMEESAEILKGFVESTEVWAIELKENGELIGSVGLHQEKIRQLEGAKMLGYVLSEEYWGRGLMTECCGAVMEYAFRELKIPLLTVCYYSFNHRSRRVIEKLGFRYEGTLRMAHVGLDGSISDDVWYSMTREEYERKQECVPASEGNK